MTEVPPPMKPKHQAGLTLLKVVAALALLVGIVCIALPTLLSTSYGTQYLVSQINKRIAGSVQIRQLQLRWLGGQIIDDFTLRDPMGREVVYIAHLQSDAHLLNLLVGHLDIGNTLISHPRFTLISSNQGGGNSLQKALGPKKPPRRRPSPEPTKSFSIPKVHGSIVITEGAMRFLHPQMEMLALHGLQTRIVLPGDNDYTLQFSLNAMVAEGEETGNLSAKGSFTPEERFASKAKTLKDFLTSPSKGQDTLNIEASRFPLQIADQLIALWQPAYKGLPSTLFGNHLDAHLDAALSPTAFMLHAQASSPNLDLALDGTTKGGIFSLAPQSHIDFTMTPALEQRLCALYEIDPPLHLSRPTQLTLQLPEFHTPLKDGRFDLPATNFKVNINASEAFFQSPLPALDHLVLSSATLTASRPVGSQGMAVSFFSQATLQEDTFRLQLSGKTQNMDFSSSSFPDATCTATLSDFPLALLDALSELPLATYLGNQLTLTLNGSVNHSLLSGKATALSPYLEARDIPFTLGKTLEVQTESRLLYTPPPKILEGFFPQATVRAPKSFIVLLQKLLFPLHGFDPLKMQFALQLSGENVSIETGFSPVPEAIFDALSLQIRALPLENAQCHLTGTLKTQGLPKALAGPWKLFAEASPKWNSLGRFKESLFKLKASSTSENITASGKLCRDGHLEVAAPVKIAATLTPELFHLLLPKSEFIPAKPAPIKIQIDPFTAKLAPLQLKELSGKATADSLNLSFQNEQVQLSTPSLQFKADKLSAWASLEAYTSAQKKRLSGDITFNDYMKNNQLALENASFIGHLQCDAMPVALLEAFSHTGGKLVPLFGNEVKLALQGQYKAPPIAEGSLDLLASSDGFSAKASVGFDGIITIKGEPASLTWDITQDRFAYLQKLLGAAPTESNIKLLQPATLALHITAMQLPNILFSRQPEVIDPSSISIHADAKLSPMQLVDMTTVQKAFLKDWKASIQAKDFSRPISATASGLLVCCEHQSQSRTGSFQFQSLIDDLLTPNGSWNLDGMSAKLELLCKNLSVDWLCHALAANAEVQQNLLSFLGPDLDGTVHADLQQMSGPAQISIRSTYSNFTLDGFVKNGTLTLTRPATASIAVTPDLAAYLLKDVNPLFFTAISAQNPIRLHIEKEGFAVPLNPFSLAKARVNKAIVDPGVLQLTAGGFIELLLGFLKAQNLLSSERATLWCTPFTLNLEKGTVTCGRMDALLNNRVHIATWGKINLLKDRIKMQLGIDREAIEEAFHLQLPPPYMFVVEIKGPTGKAKVDWAKASARIAALIAKTSGNEKGGIVGNILDIVGGALEKRQQPPPPYVTPFPWETRRNP